MNYSFEYIDIILLAMIAGFIFLRLRGILGKRTGFEGKAPPQFEEILKITQKGMVEEVSPGYFKTGEQAEGAKAFLEKRKPNFKKFR